MFNGNNISRLKIDGRVVFYAWRNDPIDFLFDFCFSPPTDVMNGSSNVSRRPLFVDTGDLAISNNQKIKTKLISSTHYRYYTDILHCVWVKWSKITVAEKHWWR
jgi:hypothetical protein